MQKRWLVVVLVGACVSSANVWVPYHPVIGASTQPKASVVQRAIVALTDAGRDVETSDAAAGIVLSKWFMAEGPFHDDYRYRVRITVDDGGRYEVVALCEFKIDSPTWKSCTDRTDRPQFVVDTVVKTEASLR